jgi:hypothetical protein
VVVNFQLNGQELHRLEPAIRDADWLRPRFLHGD